MDDAALLLLPFVETPTVCVSVCLPLSLSPLLLLSSLPPLLTQIPMLTVESMDPPMVKAVARAMSGGVSNITRVMACQWVTAVAVERGAEALSPTAAATLLNVGLSSSSLMCV
eukprot:GHVU01143825.1.p1 GENE.GHVU01143825.1~~GHVU01143825.1.p1  ORF type:complete len:113 (+),score=26.00 GHVU01143825.1:331-669(+)